MADDVVREHSFERAEDFLAALRPGSANWQPDPGAWIFRGHADSSWLLLPSWNRRASLTAYCGPKYRGEGLYCEPTPEELGALMVQFVHALERAAQPVPGAGGRFTLPDIAEKVKGGRPSAHVHEVMALAQHYGLPTYMLDWTRHSNFAAYFAASETVNLPGELTGHIEVWALNRTIGETTRTGSKIDGDPVWLLMSMPTRVGNPPLHAQSGLFTYDLYAPAASGRLHPADAIVRAMAKTNAFTHPVMRRLRLPHSEAARVLDLLALEPVTGSILFPGLAGVVREVRDRVRLGRKG